jgi:hypothetical protein
LSTQFGDKQFGDKIFATWLHALLVVNDFLAHTVAAGIMLVLVKGLALLIEALWPHNGLTMYQGTPYEFSVETIFLTAEIAIFVVYFVYAVIRGVMRCFGR